MCIRDSCYFDPGAYLRIIMSMVIGMSNNTHSFQNARAKYKSISDKDVRLIDGKQCISTMPQEQLARLSKQLGTSSGQSQRLLTNVCLTHRVMLGGKGSPSLTILWHLILPGL